MTEPIQRWLDGLDPDAILADMRNSRGRPQHRLAFDGWEVRFQATPVSQEHRNDPNHRVLGSHTEGVALLDDAAPLRAKLKRKAGHYGELDRPYVVGLLCAGDFVEDRDIADALLGSITLRYSPATQEMETVRAPDGFWYGVGGPKNRRVSAVITIPQLSWHALAAAEPTVWVQPWAARPLSVDLPWRTHSINADGRITTTEARCPSAELFALPTGWPAS
ncbi:MAG TPA: hypothetical protein VFF79_15545 [Conexibacter sp.]|nr:hypothetical protein [Conexibacter sp.]